MPGVANADGSTKATQHVRPDELEVLSLVEPDKLKQNSLTLVRRTGRPSA
jgi:hypothetical protein